MTEAELARLMVQARSEAMAIAARGCRAPARAAQKLNVIDMRSAWK